MRFVSFALLLVIASSRALPAQIDVAFAEKPEHAVLIVIDGLSYKIWDRMELPVLDALAENGAVALRVYLPPAAHPTPTLPSCL